MACCLQVGVSGQERVVYYRATGFVKPLIVLFAKHKIRICSKIPVAYIVRSVVTRITSAFASLATDCSILGPRIGTVCGPVSGLLVIRPH